jgi:hypothetical protein
MYRRTSPQLTITEPAFAISGILPDDDWSFTYRKKIWPLIDENQFKHLYEKEGGAPNISIKLKMSLLIFMALEELNWREVEFMYMRRIDWINATYTDFGNAFIDHTTLFKFYQQLEKDDSAYNMFADLTERFIAECDVSTKKQRVDSFFMLGWLSTLSRYGLFKETIRVFLQTLRKHKPGLYKDVKDDLSLDYLQDNFDLTEKDKEKTRGRIKEMAKDLYLLKSAFENRNQVKHYETFNTLIQVFEQQCTTNPISDNVEIPDKEAVEVEIREKPEGDKIISNPHNTDARYTRKRNQTVVGHKGFVTETSDTENEVQFITDVNLEAATHADANEIGAIEQRLEDNNLKPKTLYGDAGFVNGASILESEAKGIDLAGPSSGRSQSFEGFANSSRPFDIADFQVEVNKENSELLVLCCPEGHQPNDQHRSEKTGKILVHFKSDVCKICSSCDRCPVKIGVRITTLTVDEAQYAGAVRHHEYMGNVEYRKECGTRAGAESLVNEIANSHDGRQARHRNEKGARLQLLFAGISCNVKRFIRFTQQKSVQNTVYATN